MHSPTPTPFTNRAKRKPGDHGFAPDANLQTRSSNERCLQVAQNHRPPLVRVQPPCTFSHPFRQYCPAHRFTPNMHSPTPTRFAKRAKFKPGNHCFALDANPQTRSGNERRLWVTQNHSPPPVRVRHPYLPPPILPTPHTTHRFTPDMRPPPPLHSQTGPAQTSPTHALPSETRPSRASTHSVEPQPTTSSCSAPTPSPTHFANTAHHASFHTQHAPTTPTPFTNRPSANLTHPRPSFENKT
ncbi:hypothetical protein K443DRAFT_11411 [Laccaria amethystina LaAM-08-1]|uniref:Uncharacterized protein n=1 Tax=Laccaria amethystina LaAM-08-1 TaxID=1095629 RepID=A0A0C9X2G5_9AGAR|nr:hypothetical protein K443DRAFT_11411 [Laccaria amethystina LaAM-08-1]